MFLPEKIVFCVDIGEEAGSGLLIHPPVTRLEWAKRLMKRFVFQKSRLNPAHQFGICTADAITLWLAQITSDENAIFKAIEQIQSEDQRTEWNMQTLFEALAEHIPNNESDYVLRVILIYCRSNVPPPPTGEYKHLLDHPRFFFDCVYLHDKASAENNVQGIYDALIQLEDDGKNRLFEVTRERRRFTIAMTKLLAHPQQRYPGDDSSWLLQPSPVVL
ncbi:hypothetical protein SpCBS45565_g04035 [Spizellomyces sp. 'palustris']|nr:hypothetical protein SpCBS45565_g04035 [Spizellomyces sp. 'palustris']